MTTDDVAEILSILVTDEENDEVQEFLGLSDDEGEIEARSFADLGVMTSNAGFELRVGNRTFQVSVVEK